jgi:hypothetical protein
MSSLVKVFPSESDHNNPIRDHPPTWRFGEDTDPLTMAQTWFRGAIAGTCSGRASEP